MHAVMFSEIKITHEFAHNLSNQTLASKMKNLEDEINESVSGLIDERGINLRPDLRKKK